MKRALPSISVLVLLGCPGKFDIDKYVIADTESGGDAPETTLDESESATSESASSESADSESASSESSESSEDTTESESSDTDVTCEPGQLDIGSACIVTEQMITTGMNAPTDIVLGDFTDDGRIDLLVAGTQVTVRPGNLQGQFGAAMIVTGASGTGLAVAELSGDNRPDFAAISANEIRMFIQMDEGVFMPDATFAVGGYDGVFGDLDGNRTTDLVVSGPLLRAFINEGGGTWGFGGESMYSGQGLAMAHLSNDDAINDIALAMTLTSLVGVFANDGTGMFQPPVDQLVTSVTDVEAVDVNADGQLDLVATNSADHNLSVLLVQTMDIVEFQLRSVGDVPVAVAVGDIDGDGIDDVAVANSGTHDVSILLGTGSGLTEEFRTLNPDIGDQPAAIEIADVDDDGDAEIVVGMLGSNRVIVYGHAG